MYYNAILHSTRKDSRPWSLSDFVPLVSHAIESGEYAIQQAREESQPGAHNRRALEQISERTGMQAGEMSAEEYQKLVDAERERIAKIPT